MARRGKKDADEEGRGGERGVGGDSGGEIPSLSLNLEKNRNFFDFFSHGVEIKFSDFH